MDVLARSENVPLIVTVEYHPGAVASQHLAEDARFLIDARDQCSVVLGSAAEKAAVRARHIHCVELGGGHARALSGPGLAAILAHRQSAIVAVIDKVAAAKHHGVMITVSVMPAVRRRVPVRRPLPVLAPVPGEVQVHTSADYEIGMLRMH